MSEKVFRVIDGFDCNNKPCKLIENTITGEQGNTENTLEANSLCETLNEKEERIKTLSEENEQLKKEYQTLKYRHSLLHDELNELEQNSEKPFLKIIDDYYVKYGDDGILFDLHKPSHIRSLMYLINRENGFSELQCEYNDLGVDLE